MIIGGVHRKYQIGVDEYILAVVCRPRSPYSDMPAFPPLVCKRGVSGVA